MSSCPHPIVSEGRCASCGINLTPTNATTTTDAATTVSASASSAAAAPSAPASTPVAAAVPSSADLKAESASLPHGWVVAWSRREHRRFYSRRPFDGQPEKTQWVPPQPEDAIPMKPAAVNARSSSYTPAAASSASYARSSSHSAAASGSGSASAPDGDGDDEANWGSEPSQSKKRRAGLGYDAPSKDEEDRAIAKQRTAMLASQPVRFVSAGGGTAAAAAASSSSSSSSAAAAPASAPVSYTVAAAAAAAAAGLFLDAAPTPGPPDRIQSASFPTPRNISNPPVYPSSLSAHTAMKRTLGWKDSQWSDPAKYGAILASTESIIANNVYQTRDTTRVAELLTPTNPLPPAPSRSCVEEEPPSLITARRNAFHELDCVLTRLVVEAGLREQPIMAFLRWGFNQRSLQNPALSAEEADPLLPMDPCEVDTCLSMELKQAKLSSETASHICAELAKRCKEQAAKLIKFRKRLMAQQASGVSVMRRFTLLLPNQADQLWAATDAAAAAFGTPTAAASANAIPPGFHRPPSHNQHANLQYHIVYDLGGESQWAIPLNAERFGMLLLDYQRTQSCTLRDQGRDDQVFLRRLWSMCARYDTISGAGYQAALPEAGFEVLREKFGVSHECYASPLNHCLPSFGSAFLDTDHWFGSKGSFLEQRPLQGSFEANPPFLEEVMATMAFHVLGLIERAEQARLPLCIVCIWPGWDDTPAYDLLLTSRFMRQLVVFEKEDHSYKEGLQHRVTSNVYRKSRARSFVFWMQSTEATKTWPVNAEAIAEFKRAFMQNREAPRRTQNDREREAPRRPQNE